MEFKANKNAKSDSSAFVDVDLNDSENWTSESLSNGKFARI